MKRLNIAMLGEQQTQQVVVDQNNEALATDQDMSQIKQSGYEIDNVEAIVQEASDTVDALRNTTQRIEQMPATSPEVIQIAQEQIAYFEKRTGIKMSSVTTAMESYTPNRKQELVKQMRLATEKLNSNISIAQEGILDRIKNRFSLVHSSVEKLKKELDNISITDGSLKTEEIKDPAFARVLNPDGKQKLSTTDVLSFVKNTVEISDKSATVKVLRDLTSQLKEVIILMKRQNTTYDEDEQEVQKSTEIINYSYDSAKEVLEELEYKYAKNSSDVEPLNYNDAISLKTLTLSLLDNKEIQNAEEAFKTTFDEFEKITESHFKKGGKGLLQDTYLAKHNLSKLAPKAYSVIEKITAVRFEVAHACVKYIKASTTSI